MDYNIIAGAEIKADVYCGDNCDQHEPYIEAWCEGDMDTTKEEVIVFDVKRWPVGTKIQVQVPCCPNCHLDAEHQNDEGECECGFDWKNWAEEQYS